MINTDEVPEHIKTTLKFQTAFADMTRQLNRPGFIDVLCAHEAAHVIYAQMRDSQIEYEAMPPSLMYDESINDVVGRMAAVRFLNLPEIKQENWKEVFTFIAHGLVSGSVVARKLKSKYGYGEEGDKLALTRMCGQLTAASSGMTINVEIVWSNAITAVDKQLDQHSEIMELIHAKAAELKPQFGF